MFGKAEQSIKETEEKQTKEYKEHMKEEQSIKEPKKEKCQNPRIQIIYH